MLFHTLVMPTCVVVGCKVRATKENSVLGLRLHRFPRNPHRRQLWVNAINRPNWIASDNDRICGLHFHSRCPVRNTDSIDYVPTIFSPRLQDESNFVTKQSLKYFNIVNNRATRYPDVIVSFLGSKLYDYVMSFSSQGFHLGFFKLVMQLYFLIISVLCVQCKRFI